MGERASSRSDIAALKPRFRQISYASGVFFTLAMHQWLLTNFFLGRFHLGLGPSLHRLSPQQPHFLDNPLFDRVGLLEIFPRIRYRHGYSRESLAKTRVRLKNCRKRLVAQFRRRHMPSPPRFSNRQHSRITLNRTPFLVLIHVFLDNARYH